MFLAVMANALHTETLTGANGKTSTRDVLKVHPALAPVKCAIMPLKRNHPGASSKSKRCYEYAEVVLQLSIR